MYKNKTKLFNNLKRKDLEKDLENISTNFDFLLKQNEKMSEEIEELKSEHYKDKEIKRLREENTRILENIHRGFEITEEDAKKISEWKLNHEINVHKLDTVEKRIRSGGVSGGKWSYEFVPTGIGIFSKCICNSCERRAREEARGNEEKYKKLIEKYDAKYDFSDVW